MDRSCGNQQPYNTACNRLNLNDLTKHCVIKNQSEKKQKGNLKNRLVLLALTRMSGERERKKRGGNEATVKAQHTFTIENANESR